MSRFYQKVISLSRTREDFLPVQQSHSISVVPDPTTTVVDEPATTDSPAAAALPAPLGAALWRAEVNSALFAPSRVRRVERAQDALTHVEESVYDCLWGPKNTAKDDFRFAKIGYDRIAKAARITKRNAALIVERLIEKGFLAGKASRPATPNS